MNENERACTREISHVSVRQKISTAKHHSGRRKKSMDMRVPDNYSMSESEKSLKMSFPIDNVPTSESGFHPTTLATTGVCPCVAVVVLLYNDGLIIIYAMFLSSFDYSCHRQW